MKSKIWTIIALAVILTLVASLSLPVPVRAAWYDDDGIIEAGETIEDDVFLTGDTVRMDGVIHGTLFAIGGDVTINGEVTGDVFAMGQRVTVSETATITGNLFSGGANIQVDGQVGGSIAGGSTSLVLGGPAGVGRNLYYGGFGLETAQGSRIERDIYVGAYQAVLNGTVTQDLVASVAAARINGIIQGDATLDVAEPGAAPQYFDYWGGPAGFQMPDPIPQGILVGEGAEIGGSLTYTSPVRQDEAIAVVPGGGLVYQTPTPVPGRPSTSPGQQEPGRVVLASILGWLWDFLRTLVTLLVLGLLAAWLIPTILERILAALRGKPVESAGYGLLAFLGGYLGILVAGAVILAIGIFLSLVTLGGLARTIFGVGFSGLGLVTALFSLLVGYGSKLIVAYLIGELILAAAARNLNGRRYWAVVLGVVIYSLVRSVPFLGWVIGVLATLFGLGAAWLAWRAWRAERRAALPAG